MAKPKKKKSSMKKSAARKTPPARKAAKSARKVPAKRSASKKAARVSAKAVKRLPKISKSRKAITDSPIVLLGRNHREKRLDPFTLKQQEKLLQLRDALVHSIAGVPPGTLRSRAEVSEASAF